LIVTNRNLISFYLQNSGVHLGQKQRGTENISRTGNNTIFTGEGDLKSDGLTGLKQLHNNLENQKMDYTKTSQFLVNPLPPRDIYSPFHEHLSGKTSSNDPHHSNSLPFPFSAKLPLNGFPENGYSKNLHSGDPTMNNSNPYTSCLPYPFLPPHMPDSYILNGLDNNLKKLKTKNGLVGQDTAISSLLKRKEKVDGDSSSLLPKKKKVKKQKDKMKMPSISHYPGSEFGEFNADSVNSDRQREWHQSKHTENNNTKDSTSEQVQANVEKILRGFYKDKDPDINPSLNVSVNSSSLKQDTSSNHSLNCLNNLNSSITKGSLLENSRGPLLTS